MTDKTKYVDMFVEEAQEHLQILNQALLDLEKKGFDKELMNAAYRIVHTIKGSASVLGIDAIGDLAHVMEDLFDLLRADRDILDSDVLDLLFKSLDIIESMVHELLKRGKVETNGSEVIEQMRSYMRRMQKPSNPDNRKDIKNKHLFHLTPEQKNQVMEILSQGQNIYELNITIDEKVRFKEGRVLQFVNMLSSIGYVIASAPDTKDIDDSILEVKLLLATKEKKSRVKEMAEEITGISNTFIIPMDSEHAALKITKNSATPSSKTKGNNQRTNLTKSDTIRVKSKLLDKLLDLVGEIMISNIRVNQIAIDTKNKDLQQVLKNNERLISELQDIVLRMRMVPVDHIFKRFPRMVRDMAKEEGKDINFKIIGHDIEIDRSLLDEIGDTLVHLLRNAVDHGIEPENERKSIGKKPYGFIKLSAFREQSNIIITVEDDGKGINIENITKKAITNGMISQEDADNLDTKQKLQFAFQPGISTASKVTEISGRGVGLDVVKSKIEALGGTVKLTTNKGKGTKFTMKLPPSMSIIGAMLVEVNKENYAIPLENVCETTKVALDDVHEFARSGVFRLRDEILPLLNVHSEFGGEEAHLNEEMPVIIVEKDENRAGLIVSKFIGKQEIVVKTLNRDLRQAQYFSGATILGDGNVALILDVGALI